MEIDCTGSRTGSLPKKSRIMDRVAKLEMRTCISEVHLQYAVTSRPSRLVGSEASYSHTIYTALN
jgi:hypothetical protein